MKLSVVTDTLPDTMSDQLLRVCEGCREVIGPGDPDVVNAHELVKTEAMGPRVEMLPGLRVVFHAGCFPEGHPGYRRI